MSKLTLKDLLSKLNCKYVDELKYLTDNLFSLTMFDNEGTPMIKTKRKSVIIFDCEDFNGTYLIDLVIKAVEEDQKTFENVDFYYVDKVPIRGLIFDPRRKLVWNDTVFPSALFILNPFGPENGYFANLRETLLSPLTINDVQEICKYLTLENIDGY